LSIIIIIVIVAAAAVGLVEVLLERHC